MFRPTAALALSICLAIPTVCPAAESGVKWQGWDDQLFQRANSEHKLVILDLEAIWCHWCHVMEKTTYADPQVQKLLADHFIAVKVDQDSRPDLSNRYEDYGWPATILYSSSGQELAKLSGYVPPERMASILAAFVKDPTPGPSASGPAPRKGPQLSGDAASQQLVELLKARYDKDQGGWGDVHKYLDPDNIEISLRRAAAGDKTFADMARQTLDANRALIDPAWGGVYQYSTGGRWDQPHFEKIMYYQAANLRSYSYAWSLWHRDTDRQAAADVARYLRTFLKSPDGAFYTSQDADLVQGEHSDTYFKLTDAQRRAKGLPRIDQHRYARENGWAIEALATYGAAVEDPTAIADAAQAADWVIAHRSIPGGGFRHDEKDPAGPYLGDTVAMGRAFLILYQVTADRRWLQHAKEALSFIDQNFKDASGGYVTAKTAPGAFAAVPQRDENLALARFANLLGRYTGAEAPRAVAAHAMKYLEGQSERNPAGLLLITDEIKNDPPHVTVIGSKKDEAARALFATAADTAVTGYRRVEWWDPAEGPLPNSDVQYPQLSKAASFLCANGSCSLPYFDAKTLKAKITESAGG
jgi:uncharacterized protein YyaL (SSP411 family)